MGGGAAAAGRVGPNALTQMAAALGPDAAPAVFRAAGLAARLAAPPRDMVPEAEVTALHRALRQHCGDARAGVVSGQAGRLTAEYLLANRIPRALQWLLLRVPARLAARILVAAIRRHAWTFAGSGRFRILPGWPMRLEIEGGPIARAAPASEPVCAYYAATFETLFRALVSARTKVEEISCEAAGARACVFELRW